MLQNARQLLASTVGSNPKITVQTLNLTADTDDKDNFDKTVPARRQAGWLSFRPESFRDKRVPRE